MAVKSTPRPPFESATTPRPSFKSKITVRPALQDGKFLFALTSHTLIEGENSPYFVLDGTLEDGREHQLRLFPNSIDSAFSHIGVTYPGIMKLEDVEYTDVLDALINQPFPVYRVSKRNKKMEWSTYWNFHEAPVVTEVATDQADNPFA